MRESIGGTWLLGFVVAFIVIFSAYLAVSINYTKAFKVKNQIINLIEENEGFSKDAEEKIYDYLDNIGYATVKIETAKCPAGEVKRGGYCLKKICTRQGSYYKVTSFIKIELPIIWQSFTIPISGETKVLYNTSDGKC